MPESLGERGEEVATAYLRSRGYKILERNWDVTNHGGKRIGELDIIAKTKDRYAFVEVKSGKTKNSAWRPEVHMTEEKMRKLVRTAHAWLGKQGKLDSPWSIDLVAVDFSQNPPAVRHYCHAEPN